jgi:hypothetical protein
MDATNGIVTHATAAVGDRIRLLVERSEHSFAEVDALAGLPRGTLWNLANEPGREPRLALLRTVRATFRVRYGWLIDGSGPAVRTATSVVLPHDADAMRRHVARALARLRSAKPANDNRRVVSRLHRPKPAARRAGRGLA